MITYQHSKPMRLANLLQEANGSAQDLETLQKVLPRIYSTFDIDQLFSIVVEEAIKLTGADRGCFIVVQQNQAYAITVARDALGNHLQPEGFQISHTVVSAILASKKALVKNDVWNDDTLRLKQSIVDLGLRMIFGAPVIDEASVVGILYLDSIAAADQEALSTRRLCTLETLAAQMAVAWRQARLHHKLQILDAAKSDFISIVSHELRTPLALIKGFCEILPSLIEGAMTEEIHTATGGILKGVSRLEDVVNLTLCAGQITQANLRLHPHPYCIRALARQVIEYWQAEIADDRQLHIEMVVEAPDDDSLLLDIDVKHMETALGHLVQNSIKFTADGGSILIHLSRSADNGIVIKIIDTGIGVEQDKRELIFEKFYRGENSKLHSTGRTKFMGAGPGLGLYLVRGIIGVHGGRVWVEDNYDPAGRSVGSKFVVQLPPTTWQTA